MKLTEEQIKNKLTPEEYEVLREAGTERPHTGVYTDDFSKGTYHCKVCDAKLFESGAKYQTSCGWPSFEFAIEGSITYNKDYSHGMFRIETKCANCDSHLGHKFDRNEYEGKDRYCINSICLKKTDE